MHERFQCFKTTPKRVNLSAKDIKNYFSVRFVAYFASNINKWCLAAVESFQSQILEFHQNITGNFNAIYGSKHVVRQTYWTSRNDVFFTGRNSM